MSDFNEDRLADVVNQEPIVFNDCTQSELAYSFGGGMSLGIAVGLILATVGSFMFCLILGLFLGLGLSWLSMFGLKFIRQKYYETWLNEKIFIFKKSLGFLSNVPFINESKRYGKGVRRRE
jgi:hypothetical protein